jgi:hypothetical protein
VFRAQASFFYLRKLLVIFLAGNLTTVFPDQGLGGVRKSFVGGCADGEKIGVGFAGHGSLFLSMKERQSP